MTTQIESLQFIPGTYDFIDEAVARQAWHKLFSLCKEGNFYEQCKIETIQLPESTKIIRITVK